MTFQLRLRPRVMALALDHTGVKRETAAGAPLRHPRSAGGREPGTPEWLPVQGCTIKKNIPRTCLYGTPVPVLHPVSGFTFFK